MNIYIGYEESHPEMYEVCKASIERFSNLHIIKPLRKKHLIEQGVYSRPFQGEATDFSFTRFLVPYLMNFQGWAIYADGDMVCLEDIRKLWDLRDANYAVQVVKHDYKTKVKNKYWGNKNEDYPRKNWSSVVLFNCSHKSNKILTPELISRSQGSYLHRFSWLKDEEIGSLPINWNYLVKEFTPNPKASLLHYTVGTPCFSEYNNGPEAQIWNNCFSNLIQGFDNLNQKKEVTKI